MKGGVAAMIAAAARDRRSAAAWRPAGSIVAAVVDEEHSSIGADALVKTWRADARDRHRADRPGDRRRPQGVRVGRRSTVEGKAAHGSRPAEGQDAILRLGPRARRGSRRSIATLQARPPHPLVGTGSLHASIVAGRPRAEQLSRSRDAADGAADAAGRTGIDGGRRGAGDPRRAQRARTRHFAAPRDAMFSRPAYEVPADHELPRVLAAALARAGGRPRITGASFWTDAAVLGHAGIPSILFGPGGAGLHSIEEYVNVADVMMCRDALVELAIGMDWLIGSSDSGDRDLGSRRVAVGFASNGAANPTRLCSINPIVQ